MMLTDAELASMRSTQESAFPDTVDIYRQVFTDDLFGGVESVEVVKVSGPLATRIVQAQVIETPGIGRDLEKEVWIVRLPFGVNILDGDIVHWLETGLIIRVVDRADRSYGTALTVKGERVKGVKIPGLDTSVL